MLLKMALRNVLRQKRRSFLTILSLAGGYALFNLALSTTQGSYGGIIAAFTESRTGHLQIHAPGYIERPSLRRRIKNGGTLLQKLQSHEDIRAFTPRVKGSGLAYHKEKAAPGELWGVRPSAEDQTTRLSRKVKHGRYLNSHRDQSDRFELLMGANLAKILRCQVGDSVVILSQGVDGSVANDEYTLVGIVGDELSSESRRLIIPLAAAQEFFSLTKDSFHEVAVLGENYRHARALSDTLSQSLQGMNLQVQPWQVVAKQFYDVMETDKKGNQISLSIIIVMLALGVLNTILMSVMERVKEYGVLKALGTRPSRIFSLILMESSLMAIAAIMLGFCFCLPINYIFMAYGISLPEPIEMEGLYFSVLRGEFTLYTNGYPALSVFIATVAVTLYPAIRSAQINPIQALRGWR